MTRRGPLSVASSLAAAGGRTPSPSPGRGAGGDGAPSPGGGGTSPGGVSPGVSLSGSAAASTTTARESARTLPAASVAVASKRCSPAASVRSKRLPQGLGDASSQRQASVSGEASTAAAA